MKNKKQKLIIFGLLACSIGCLSMATRTVSADRTEIFSENKVYYGEVLTLDNTDSFKQRTVVLPTTDLETPLMEFCILPSQVGTVENYTPDFERMYIDIYDPADVTKSLSISVYEHYLVTRATEMSERHIAVNAAGAGQSLAAEWRGDGVKYKDVLGTGYGGNIAQSFDGYVHANSYIDENGNAIKNGSNRAIRLFYDMEENALYTDVGRSNENTQITTTSGKFRWRIRDFDKSDYKNSEGNVIETTTWSGFEEGDKLTVSVKMDKIVDEKQPKVLFSVLAGERLLKSPIVVSTPSKGETNVEYKIPKPVYYDMTTYSETSFASVEGEYKVEKRADGGNIAIK